MRANGSRRWKPFSKRFRRAGSWSSRSSRDPRFCVSAGRSGGMSQVSRADCHHRLRLGKHHRRQAADAQGPLLLALRHDAQVDKETGKISDRPDELLARCKDAGLDGLDLKYDSELTPEFMAKMKAARLELIVWTVNEPDVARRMAALGVLGITTDRPAWLREQLQAAAK